MTMNCLDFGIWPVDSATASLSYTTGWSWSFLVKDKGASVWRKVLKHASEESSRKEFMAGRWAAQNGVPTPSPTRRGVARYRGDTHWYIEFLFQQHRIFSVKNITDNVAKILDVIHSIGTLPLLPKAFSNESLYSDLFTGFVSGSEEYMVATGKNIFLDFALLWKEEVFVHGDCSIKNFGLTPKNCCYCFDFQWASVGPIGFDTAFFFADVSRDLENLSILHEIIPNALDFDMAFACSLIKLGRAKRRNEDLSSYIEACMYWQNCTEIKGAHKFV